MQKIYGKSLNRASVISKVYKLVKSLKGDARKKFLNKIFNADAGTTCVLRRKS